MERGHGFVLLYHAAHAVLMLVPVHSSGSMISCGARFCASLTASCPGVGFGRPFDGNMHGNMHESRELYPKHVTERQRTISNITSNQPARKGCTT
ncbi:hypothetical protein HYDPIDRAFT_111912 [Hydnomerulius pinastri MD-312]|uniref:Secreted protein n=1 Tax=Hydnomerulius pinastri MD-312 TaxID=994086 RepID=A0A0C9W141_9AGAM|nr:hypothetical protein HYDPIDRAFT_111912 [Hydnomerulius pinastri MD-312]